MLRKDSPDLPDDERVGLAEMAAVDQELRARAIEVRWRRARYRQSQSQSSRLHAPKGSRRRPTRCRTLKPISSGIPTASGHLAASPPGVLLAGHLNYTDPK